VEAGTRGGYPLGLLPAVWHPVDATKAAITASARNRFIPVLPVRALSRGSCALLIKRARFEAIEGLRIRKGPDREGAYRSGLCG
jgi:hypothetical protein